MIWLQMFIIVLSVYVILEAIAAIAMYWSAWHMLECWWEAIEDTVWSIIGWIRGDNDD